MNLLGDLKLSQVSGFVYEIYYSKPGDSTPINSKTAIEGETVTFNNVTYGTYTFYLKIWVNSKMKAWLNILTVNKTVSESDSTVKFDDMKTSDYSEWFFVSDTASITQALDDINAGFESGRFSAEKQAKLCPMQDIEYSVAPPLSKISYIEIVDSGYKIISLYSVNIVPSDHGSVTSSPTSPVVKNTLVTITVSPVAGYELEKLSVKKSGDEDIEVTEDAATGTFSFDMPDSDVTVTASFKAAEVDASSVTDNGAVALKNGKFVTYANLSKMSDTQKADAIAVIFDATNKLGVGLAQGTNLEWAISGASGYTSRISSLETANSGSGYYITSAALSGNGETNPSNSFTTFKSACTDFETNKDKYPAWAWIESYAETAGLSETDYADGWYFPSAGQLCKLYRARTTVDTALSVLGKSTLSGASIWSCCTSDSRNGPGDRIYAWYAGFSDGSISDDSKNSLYNVRAIRSFSE